MRSFKSGEQRFRLVHDLLIFSFRSGICNYAASRLDVSDAVFHDHGTKRDAGVEVAREIKVENSASIDSAAGALEGFHDFPCANFGGPGERAGPRTGPPAGGTSP